MRTASTYFGLDLVLSRCVPRVRSVVRESVIHNPFVSDDEGDPTKPSFVKDGIKVSLHLWNEPIGKLYPFKLCLALVES